MSQPPEICGFCRILETASAEREWYDVSLYEDENFVVIPGLGPQSELYLLVIPRQHVYSIGQLPPELIERLERLLARIEDILAPTFGALTVFEHGSCDAKQRNGGCIDHAHLHLLSTELPLASAVASRDALTPIGALGELAQLSEVPYVFVRDRAGLFAGTVDGAGGQHVRRVFAELSGRPDEWDYAVIGGSDRIRAIIATAGPLLARLGFSGDA